MELLVFLNICPKGKHFEQYAFGLKRLLSNKSIYKSSFNLAKRPFNSDSYNKLFHI